MQRQYRLRHNRDFQRLRRDGRIFRHPMLVLSHLPNGLAHNRYGFIVTRRLGRAVQRNRVRRLLREAVRRLHPRLAAGYDIVLITRPAIADETYSVVEQTVESMCRRAGLVEESTQ